ncbi:MAG: hypothetical protein E6H56_16695 [Betaproteobacteria bacterium]|nr:MAG: hypothetical protein E6H56_16695 [Betaproteobacteria bacterium]
MVYAIAAGVPGAPQPTMVESKTRVETAVAEHATNRFAVCNAPVVVTEPPLRVMSAPAAARATGLRTYWTQPALTSWKGNFKAS